ncbi:unnamed protein product, partial [Symbiodinium sp. CCMP2456]
PSPFAPSLGRGPGGCGAPWTSSVPSYDPPPSSTGLHRPLDRGLGIDAQFPRNFPSAGAPEFGTIPGSCLHREHEYIPDHFGERWRRTEQLPRSRVDAFRHPDRYSDPFAQQRSTDTRPGPLRGWEDTGFGDRPDAGRWDPLPGGEPDFGLPRPTGASEPTRVGRWRQPQPQPSPVQPGSFASYTQPEMHRPFQAPPSMTEAWNDIGFGAAWEARKDLPHSFGLGMPPEARKGPPSTMDPRFGTAPAEGPAVERKPPSACEARKDLAAPAAEAPTVIVMGDGCVKDPGLNDAPQAAAQSPAMAAFERLKGCEAQLQSARAELRSTEDALQTLQVSPGQAWNDLAQLEARLDQLQCKGIDFVSTEGLSTEDEESARTKRRQLTKAVANLQDQVEAVFDRLKSARGT